ncbi:MAG: prenyltransferase/squalene oxidase repeat-containing protein [Chitinophagaceae bacterium]
MRKISSKTELIRLGVLFIFSILYLPFLSAQSKYSWKTALLNYINKDLLKQDGGYGWQDQPDSHLTPTYAVVGILKNLDGLPGKKENLIDFVRSHHPQRGKNKEAGPSGTEERDLVFQQMQSLLWLNADISSFKGEVLAWKPQNNKVSNFEEHGYPVFLQEMMTPVCRGLLNASFEDVQEHFSTYLQSRRRPNGSFNNTPVTDGGDGNIINTYWGLFGSKVVMKKQVNEKEAIEWIRSSQLENGGFTHQPNPVIGGNDEVAYTWAAVRALKLLSSQPLKRAACIRYIISLHNDDGGFGNRPGLPSTPMAAYYAIDVLKTLDALSSLDAASFVKYPVKKAASLTGMKVFTVQFEASGVGSPAEAVMLADSLDIDLWGTKNSNKAWRAIAQKIADEKKVPVTFFQADEAYGKSVTLEGHGTFSHIMDYIAPATATRELALDGSSWQRYRQSFIEPLLKDGGALVLQVTNNEPMGRMILDESVKNGGFAAISTIHFGQNFSFWLPWLHEYRHQLPFIALQDAHGTESWWWADELAGYRTLFLAKNNSYEAMMEALKNNRIVAVRHDSVSDYKTRILGGADGIQAFIRARETDWRWWKEGARDLNRPWAAMTAVSHNDSFEVARPLSGVNIRIRCRWAGVRQTLKEPMVILETLKVDNLEVQTKYVEKKDKNGSFTDSYYIYPVEKPAKGRHTLEANFRNLRDNNVRKMTSEFVYSGE